MLNVYIVSTRMHVELFDVCSTQHQAACACIVVRQKLVCYCGSCYSAWFLWCVGTASSIQYHCMLSLHQKKETYRMIVSHILRKWKQ
jgi:hypothetical protein